MSLRIVFLHVCVLGALLLAGFLLPDYHQTFVARALVLAAFAMGYNLTFGYGGLLSLGHSMFFAAGIYGAGLPMLHFGWSASAGLVASIISALILSLVTMSLALRTRGVAFMIVTLMFAQVGAHAVLYFSEWTRGDEGFVLHISQRMLPFGIAPTDPTARYLIAWTICSTALAVTLAVVKSRFGRSLVATRENEERAALLGYNVFAIRLKALLLSAALSGLAGGAYAILFGYVGGNFAGVQYSILPLLWVLAGGAATTLGPVLGTLAISYLIDFASAFTSAWLFFVGAVLVMLVLFFPKGMLGSLRERYARWLP
ncbi:branched-chain amino acid ABC transporter permease [Limoniibacter endophyticus]|uniref:Branched-chain amino acid ABC transporter permease n=1 Tax=Limoniibacter endophyticus TaxID=1565040 RepID=A0A8J3GJS7_9HYPH|nr:branched-chain amino acid ABC transporter permease [Limoniibacter endophyticus]GHC80115.1 branched-chain amino acid ABC transporter permease [Limoniibacter endophyticus]